MADLPLGGLRVVVTRPEAQAQALSEGLERLGALVARVPLVEIEPLEATGALDAVAAELPRYDWVVFTSANGVRAFGDRLTALGEPPTIATVGPSTADAVRTLGVEPAVVGAGVAEDLAAGLEGLVGARVLLLQADIAEPALAQELRARGALVDAVTAYRTAARTPPRAELADLEGADAIVLASGSAARSLAALSRADADVLVACIGHKTARVAREVGLRVGLVADEATADGIIRALVDHYAEST